MPRNPRLVSMRTPLVWACPDSDVPPERNVTGTPWRAARRTASATSEPSRATTTTVGSSR